MQDTIPFPLSEGNRTATRLRALVIDDDDIDHLRLQRICDAAQFLLLFFLLAP